MPKGEHAGPVEQEICMVKQEMRGWTNTTPFNKVALLLLIHAVVNVAQMLNNYPRKGGVTINFSLHMLMTGKQLDMKRQLKCPVGA